MISITGRRPETAAPKPAPEMTSSEIGVSNTRSAPWRSCSPGVAANTPPGFATSSPKKTTVSSRSSSSSSASRIARRNSIVVVAGSAAVVVVLNGRLLHEKAQRLLEPCADGGQEGGGVRPEENAVIRAEREGHHVPRAQRPIVADDRAALERADGEDGGLGHVDHRGEAGDPVHPEVG